MGNQLIYTFLNKNDEFSYVAICALDLYRDFTKDKDNMENLLE